MKSEDRPPKILYQDQEDAFESFKRFIIPYLKANPSIQEAGVWAGLAEKKFGNYERPCADGKKRSDVDLVLVIREEDIPKNWEFMTDKSWFKGYISKEFRKFHYQGNNHDVDVLVVKKEKLEKAREQIKTRGKIIYIKQGTNSILE